MNFELHFYPGEADKRSALEVIGRDVQTGAVMPWAYWIFLLPMGAMPTGN